MSNLKGPKGPNEVKNDEHCESLTLEDVILISRCLQKSNQKNIYFPEELIIVKKLQSKLQLIVNNYIQKNTTTN